MRVECSKPNCVRRQRDAQQGAAACRHATVRRHTLPYHLLMQHPPTQGAGAGSLPAWRSECCNPSQSRQGPPFRSTQWAAGRSVPAGRFIPYQPAAPRLTAPLVHPPRPAWLSCLKSQLDGLHINWCNAAAAADCPKAYQGILAHTAGGPNPACRRLPPPASTCQPPRPALEACTTAAGAAPCS